MDDYSSVLQHSLSAFVNGDIIALRIPEVSDWLKAELYNLRRAFMLYACNM